MGENIINPFKFNYRGFEVGCLKVVFNGLYVNDYTWKIVVKGKDFYKEFTSKVICNSGTKQWAIDKGIEIVDSQFKSDVFNYNEFFDKQEELIFNSYSSERRYDENE